MYAAGKAVEWMRKPKADGYDSRSSVARGYTGGYTSKRSANASAASTTGAPRLDLQSHASGTSSSRSPESPSLVAPSRTWSPVSDAVREHEDEEEWTPPSAQGVLKRLLARSDGLLSERLPLLGNNWGKG